MDSKVLDEILSSRTEFWLTASVLDTYFPVSFEFVSCSFSGFSSTCYRWRGALREHQSNFQFQPICWIFCQCQCSLTYFIFHYCRPLKLSYCLFFLSPGSFTGNYRRNSKTELKKNSLRNNHLNVGMSTARLPRRQGRIHALKVFWFSICG